MIEEVDTMPCTLWIYLLCSHSAIPAIGMALKLIWKPKQVVKVALQVEHLWAGDLTGDHHTWAELEDQACGQPENLCHFLMEALGLVIATVMLGKEVLEMLTEEK
jgi:hypothetical protein